MGAWAAAAGAWGALVLGSAKVTVAASASPAIPRNAVNPWCACMGITLHRLAVRAGGRGYRLPELTIQVPSSTSAAEMAIRVEKGSDSNNVPSVTAMIGLMYA